MTAVAGSTDGTTGTTSGVFRGPRRYNLVAAALHAAQSGRVRWVEYSFSASLMMVLIAQIAGITDVAALTAIFAVNQWMQYRPIGRWSDYLVGERALPHAEPGSQISPPAAWTSTKHCRGVTVLFGFVLVGSASL